MDLPESGTARAIIVKSPERLPPEPLSVLSRAERTHFDGILNPLAARDFAAGRILIRMVVGSMTGTTPAQVPLQVARGRPFLRSNPFGLDLNLSHGADHLCLAIGRGILVGADIEAVPGPDGLDEIAAMTFSERECRILRRLGRRARAEAFCRLWTRREAALKRSGTGLAGNDRTRSYLGRLDRIRFAEGRLPDARWCVALPPARPILVHQRSHFPDLHKESLQ
jgi:4'-phosphopantetheinyl transferase